MTPQQIIEQEIDTRSRQQWQNEANEYANEETKSYREDIKDVCYYERHIAFEYAIQAGFEQGANFALSMDRWVKVETGLPETEGRYLCLCEKQEYVLSFSAESKRFYMNFHIKKYFEDWTEYVTHWQAIQSLPSPPKE